MNIARRDKRRTNDERETLEERRPRERSREGIEVRKREGIIARARVKDTEKGFLVAHSVCKMGSQPCTPHPSSRPLKGMYKTSSRVDRSVPNRSFGVFKARRDNSIRNPPPFPLCLRVCLENINGRRCHNTSTAMI